MAQHINGKCNLSELGEKQVNCIATNDYGLTQTKKDSGDIVVLTENDHHEIYIAGEFIAGGHGFEDDIYVSELTSLVNNDNYSYISYIINNADAVKQFIGKYNESETTSDVEVTTPDNSDTSFIIGDTTYTLTTNEYDKLYFERNCDTKILTADYVLNVSDSKIISNDPIVVKAGTSVNFLQLTLTAEGTTNIAYLDIYDTFVWEHTISTAHKLGTDYTNYSISTEKFDNEIVLRDSNYSHTSSNGSNIETLELVNNIGGSNSVTIAYRTEDYIKNTMPSTYQCATIYWQLPYFYGTTEFSASLFDDYNDGVNNTAYRTDISFDTMINTEFTISFNTAWSNRSYGYFACPAEWCDNGDPLFIIKESNVGCKWEKISEAYTRCMIGDEYINYYIFKSPQMYYGGKVTWIVK